ncbi:MAG TPA: DUF4286 family protein [Ferruginibacter sp.]|nr:DUF4286 family protein [Niastella sp.]HRB31070.1 DUF4286 family protein [Ferruginibacter sp.]
MSFIYNVTIKVTPHIHEDWIQWLKEEHVPEVTSTGCFEKAIIVRLLETDDSEGPTYAVQYFVNSKADYNRYIELHAARMRQKSFDKWGNQFLAFRSIMEIVN